MPRQKEETKQVYTELPDDNFGVQVDNDMDRRRLLWLLNEIGEKKLRQSASRRGRFPENPLYVSKILSRYGLKVPTSVYAPVRVPTYFTYLLVLKDRSVVKVGMTGDWPHRCYAFLRSFRTTVDDTFDLDLSLAFPADSKVAALEIERTIMRQFANHSAPTPYDRNLIRYGCGGHKEWFHMETYEELVLAMSGANAKYTLRESLNWGAVDYRTPAVDNPDWAKEDHGQHQQ